MQTGGSAPSGPPGLTPTSAEAGTEWLRLVPAEQREVLQLAASRLQSAGVEALLGGALAFAHYVGRWRGTKDVDFFLRPAQREAAIAALRGAGFGDYFDTLPYDRSWIFRACRDDAIVDLIWTLPNHVTEVDEAWFSHSVPLAIGDQVFRVIPAEELIWIKLFVLQRDRCDWPDVLNVLRCRGRSLDWERLLARTAENTPLLQAALTVLAWLSPQETAEFPDGVRARFGLHAGDAAGPATQESRRAGLIDSRPWFAPLVPPESPMGPAAKKP